MRLILLGAPGSGKGTATVTLLESFPVKKAVSTGDMFRENIKNNTELGAKANDFISQGKLVPDEITIDIVKDRLMKDDVKDGFILDGFPRTINQANALDNFLSERGEEITKVLYFNASKETLLKRITGRIICEKCGAIYHKENIVPKVEGKCDKCGADLITRKDDSFETANKRIDVYNEETAPLIDFYKEKGILLELDANKSSVEVSKVLLEKLK